MPDKKHDSKSWMEAAGRLRERSQFALARRLYLKQARPGAGPARAEALLGAADCGRLLGRFKEAQGEYQAASRLLKADASRLDDARLGLALCLRATGQPQAAAKILRGLRARYQRRADGEALAFCDWALGSTYRIAGDMRLAQRHLEQALRAYQARGEREGQAYVSCALGGVARMLGDDGLSRQRYAWANARMRQARDTFGMAYSYCGLGNTYRMQGDFKEAMRWFKKAEATYAKIGDRVSYAYTLWSMAMSLKMLEQWRDAAGLLRKAEKLFKSTGDPRGLAYVEMGYSGLEALQGRVKKARAHLAKALTLSRPYAWESLHAAWLAGKAPASAYAKAGSAFAPQGVPVNWP